MFDETLDNFELYTDPFSAGQHLLTGASSIGICLALINFPHSCDLSLNSEEQIGQNFEADYISRLHFTYPWHHRLALVISTRYAK